MKPLIICNNPPVYPDPCGFGSLILLTQNLITDLIILSTLLATAAFAFAGFKLLTSGGDEGSMKQAKEIFKKVVIGYLWILVAWLLVYTITSGLLNQGFSILGKPQ